MDGPAETRWPERPFCGRPSDSLDSGGCPGVVVDGHADCLAHLDHIDRAAYLTSLAPWADVDHRGTSFTPELLRELLEALKDPDTSRARFGHAGFDGATFTGRAAFDDATFTGHAGFREATFTADADFAKATFARAARFDDATFTNRAEFRKATFTGPAYFDDVTFAPYPFLPAGARYPVVPPPRRPFLDT
ncbi:pentapeptide repeat-containing protein [Streptomyces hainanensis]|uniref:pentapeptide repeat-containing protein n=1 Tax=Streptomyces hainanensis TaxID=402648 RepID=UPI001404A7F0|nr:pentapeptide repeat-containing protein [Streptomyces hainanensis]